MSRYNTSFTIAKGNKTEKKFEVIEDNNSHANVYNSINLILKKKYKGYNIQVLRAYLALSAVGGIT